MTTDKGAVVVCMASAGAKTSMSAHARGGVVRSARVAYLSCEISGMLTESGDSYGGPAE